MNYHLDYETYSSVDLRKLGHYRYAAGEDTQILMFAIAEEEGEPVLWVNPEITPTPHDNTAAETMLFEALQDEEALIYAHNAPFEAAISLYLMEKDVGFPAPDIEKWRCTAAMARKAALPTSLANCAEALQLPQQKDKEGVRLIKKFSVPQSVGKRKGERILPSEDPADWALFCEYCMQDVRTEQAIHQRLKFFELKDVDLESFLLYQRINHRGLPVDIQTLEKAATIVAESEEHLRTEFREIVGLNPTQGAKFQEWLDVFGWPFDNLQAATVTQALEDISWCHDELALDALRLKQQISFAAFKKIESMIKCACPDGRVRGSLQWYGAHTGRGSGRLIQPQNFKRPTIKNTEEVYRDLQANDLSTQDVHEKYGNPLEVISSCIRHFIHAEGDYDFLDADYASIEARIVAWLCDQTDVLQEYYEDADQYIRMGCMIFPTTEEEQLKRKAAGESTVERFVGKQAILGCGFQMGVTRFLETCNNFGFSIPEEQVVAEMQALGSDNYEEVEDRIKMELAELAVQAYRKKCYKVARMWKDIEKAAITAVKTPNTKVKAGTKLFFVCRKVAGMKYLFMYLPSGRYVAYPKPVLEDGKYGEKLSYWAQIPGKTMWGHCSTYGGKLLENATQAVAADVMSSGASTAEENGYDVATLIHDEALVYKNADWQNVDDLCELLSTLPPWAEGLPVAAEGFETKFYKK